MKASVLRTGMIFLVFTSSFLHARVAALFSPQDRPAKTLIEYIKAARNSIHAAVYLICDKDIANALVEAKGRGVDVSIIVDPLSTDSKYCKADFLAENGVNVFAFDPKTKPQKATPDRWFGNGPIMHNKFAIFDGVTVWTGSFNWTGAANTTNCENVLITDSRDICKQYEEQFLQLLTTRCKRHNIQKRDQAGDPSLHAMITKLLESTSNEATLAEQLMDLIKAHQPA